MNITLTPELKALVERKVASGLYQSASEVVREALRMLENRERLQIAQFEQMKEEIAIGIKALEEGDYSIWDEKAINEIRAMGQKMLHSEYIDG